MKRKYCKQALSLAAAMMSLALLADAGAAKAAKRFATGGEVTSFHYVTNGVGWTAFVHTFTNTAEAAEFRNRSGKTIYSLRWWWRRRGRRRDRDEHVLVGG